MAQEARAVARLLSQVFVDRFAQLLPKAAWLSSIEFKRGNSIQLNLKGEFELDATVLYGRCIETGQTCT